MAESLGSAVLTLLTNDRQLDEGLDRARERVQAAADDFQQRGERMKDIGGKLSMALTAPIAGAGAAVLASAKAIADSVPEIENFARLSGVGTTEFQRLAGAAKNVGLEADGLKDIFKDTQERIGEFLSTGGGEMKDFFENIAPKVGLTAEAFRGLSGPDALQLYYSSLEKAGLNQAEMTYYMEAVASEATNLIPLLANGGKAFDELGAKANVLTPEQIEMFKRYNAAQQQMEQSTQKLTIAIVSSGLLDGITNLVTKAADFTARLSETNPGMMQTALVIAGIVAAIGPLLMMLGMMTSGFGTLLAALPAIVSAFSALSGAMAAARVASLSLLPTLAPFLIPLAAIAAAIGAVYLAWQNWDTIKAVLASVGASISGWWTGSVQPVLTAIGTAVQKVVQIFADYFGAQLQRIVAGVSALLRGDFAGAWRAVQDFVAAPVRAALAVVEAFVPGVTGAFQRVYSGIKEWLQDKLKAVFDWFSSKVQSVKGLVDGLVEAGSVFALTVAPSPGAAVMIDDGSSPPPPPIAAQPIPSHEGTHTPASDDAGMPAPAEEEWREGFKRSFADGLRAAMNGDLGGFFQSWLQQGASAAMDNIAEWALSLFDKLLGGLGGGGGGGGIIDIIAGVFGGSGGGFGGGLSSLFAGAFATGGLIPSGKFGLVGERGPELAIASPSGTLIRPNSSLSGATLQPAAPSFSMPISIDATGADPAGLGRVQAELQALRRELPQTIVKTVQDGGERGIINTRAWR